MNVVIRDLKEGDIPLIMDSWIKQVREVAPLSSLTNQEFNIIHRPVIERMITEGIAIAVSPRDDELIYGWCCGRDCGEYNILHMIYVRGPYRKQGVSKKLLNHMFNSRKTYMTHKTKQSKFYDVSYWPYG